MILMIASINFRGSRICVNPVRILILWLMGIPSFTWMIKSAFWVIKRDCNILMYNFQFYDMGLKILVIFIVVRIKCIVILWSLQIMFLFSMTLQLPKSALPLKPIDHKILGGNARQPKLNLGPYYCSLLAFAHGQASNTSLTPAMFIFGETMINSENNNCIMTIARANYKHPYGIDFGYPTDRFCNGISAADCAGTYKKIHTSFSFSKGDTALYSKKVLYILQLVTLVCHLFHLDYVRCLKVKTSWRD